MNVYLLREIQRRSEPNQNYLIWVIGTKRKVAGQHIVSRVGRKSSLVVSKTTMVHMLMDKRSWV